ncbi:MAG TPA: S41 family peptidase, partial [Methanotrichaceae archaeon]|nr:S41 family peptidase [Methanotrichaceae archaeon]
DDMENFWTGSMFKRHLIAIGLLLAGLIIALSLTATAQPAIPCTTCRMDLEDACQPFTSNDSAAAAYEVAMARVLGITPEGPSPYASNYSNLSWSQAFSKANQKMKEQYAFTDWKGINWDELYSSFAPAIDEAERTGDKAQYYRTLKKYVSSVHDGHVNVRGPNYGSLRTDIGGGFGFAVCRLDSGKVAVCYVARGSQAEISGISPGDLLLEWNGMPAEAALNKTSYIWSPFKPSTQEGILLQKARFMTRAPEGTEATARVQGKDGTARDVHLLAYYDGYETLTNSTYFVGRAFNDTALTNNSMAVLEALPEGGVVYSILPNGYGYVVVYYEIPQGYSLFRKAIESFVQADVPGVIVDLRFNDGGDDSISACMSSFFLNERSLFEYVTNYNISTGKLDRLATIWSRPQNMTYSGPVAVLVSPYAISSGEGLPMMIQRRDLGKVISFYGTSGAFGIELGTISMPLGITLRYPTGQSQNAQGKVQIDSNASLEGGVSPDIRVPMTEETIEQFNEGRDVQLESAVAWLSEQRDRE